MKLDLQDFGRLILTSDSYQFIASSRDGRFNISISQSIMDKIIALCIKANNIETGGILIGYYNTGHEWAMVTEATKPSKDSDSGSTWFYRGIAGLQQKLYKLWPRRKYYLGEWHYHPNGAAIPSQTDMNQMKSISISTKYNCPEPILLIVGNRSDEFEIKSYVILRDCSVFELIETKNSWS